MLHAICYKITLYRVHIKKDIDINIDKDVERKFDISNYDLDRKLPRKKKYHWINER